MTTYRIDFMGDSAIIIQLHAEFKQIFSLIRHVTRVIENTLGDEILDIVPAYQSITLYYPPLTLYREKLLEIDHLVKMALQHNSSTSSPSRTLQIPVCYEEKYAIDLPYLCKELNLSSSQFILQHTEPIYHVQFIGFTPGFPFLSGLPATLAYPRKKTPRLKVPAGSVGIAGPQTGIYPEASPGGWQIIGRTPLKLFNINQSPPSFFRPGDAVQFTSISSSEFRSWSLNELNN
ncbi:5-oxoprolinase subunit PxpB [Bacillus sp. 2205SS5-2]|uniref:5-oxoprolinase subunit PxpB n=1 Tax=Bacillus sp. 2205SS5-2 TaxID=3109031 RepID=UPI0030077873